MEGPTNKLELGMQRLAQADDNVDMLGSALMSLHGALEDHFRAWLSQNQLVPSAQRAIVTNPQLMQWKELLDLMQRYGNLSDGTRRSIQRANWLRQEVAHGGRYSGTRSFLDGYAPLVQSLCTDVYKLSNSPRERSADFSVRSSFVPTVPQSVPAQRQQAPRGLDQAKIAQPSTTHSYSSQNTARRSSQPRTPPQPTAMEQQSSGLLMRLLIFIIIVILLYLLGKFGIIPLSYISIVPLL